MVFFLEEIRVHLNSNDYSLKRILQPIRIDKPIFLDSTYQVILPIGPHSRSILETSAFTPDMPF
jgi:hypothetical protein